jgi:hypothetical protein
VTETHLHKSSPRGLDVSSWCRVRSRPAPPHSRGRGPASPPLPPATSCRDTHCFQGTVTVNLLPYRGYIDFFKQKIRKNHRQFQCGSLTLRSRIHYFFIRLDPDPKPKHSKHPKLPPFHWSAHTRRKANVAKILVEELYDIFCVSYNPTVLRIRIRDPVPFRPLDPGSSAFFRPLDPGSGMGKKIGSGSGMNNPDHIS